MGISIGKKILLVVLVLMSISFFTILVSSYVYCNVWHQTYKIVSGSMFPTLNRGDWVLVRTGIGIDDVHAAYETGDIVVFHQPTRPSEIIIHRAVEKSGIGIGIAYLETKGDSNSSPDNWEVYDQDLIGKVVEINSLPTFAFALSLLWIALTVVTIVSSVAVYRSLASN